MNDKKKQEKTYGSLSHIEGVRDVDIFQQE